MSKSTEQKHCHKCNDTGVYIEPGGKTTPCDMDGCTATQQQKLATNNRPIVHGNGAAGAT